MSEDENKNQKRDAMLLPFRWIKALEGVSDKDFRDMITAAVIYAETGEEPNFTGFQLGLWQEFKNRIDADKEKYFSVCEKRRECARIRWDRRNTTDAKACKSMQMDANACKRMQTHAKDAEGEGDLKERTLKSSKETAEPFSLTSDPPLKIPFTKWSEQQFREEVAKFPEYADIQEAFADYWTEPTVKGKMRFQKETAWDTCRRLKTWKQRQQERPAFQTAEDRSEYNKLPRAF